MWLVTLIKKRGATRFMTDRRIYHLTRRADDSWQVIREGFRRPHIIRETKEEAVVVAKRLARTSQEAQVIVPNDDNFIERKYCFVARSV